MYMLSVKIGKTGGFGKQWVISMYLLVQCIVTDLLKNNFKNLNHGKLLFSELSI